MADGERICKEQETLGESVKSQHNYGTAKKQASVPPELFIRHNVQNRDTLAGVALKYGVSMQQLKSVNSIFCDWQLSSRNVIFIPVSPADASRIPAVELATRQELLASHSKTLPRTTSDSAIANSSVTASSGNDSLKDYFSKYDSALAEIKDNIEKLEKSMSERLETDNPLLMLPSRKASRSNRGGTWNADVEKLDETKEPELRFMSQSFESSLVNGNASAGSSKRNYGNGRLPSASTWQRMERTHDEFFQL